MLDVAIGIVFVFVLVSLICTAVREGLEAHLKTRAAYLHYGIRELLNDKTDSGLATRFFKHPLIYGLYSGEYKQPGSEDKQHATTKRPGALTRGDNLPSYIPAGNFALALLDLAVRGPQTNASSSGSSTPVLTVDSVRANIANLANPEVQRAVLAAIDTAQGDLDRAIKNLEAWYDSGMDRVSGWYKRSTQWVILGIALFVTVLLNVNTITIVHYLSHNETARAAVVEQAQKAVDAAAAKGGATSAPQKPAAGTQADKQDGAPKPEETSAELKAARKAYDKAVADLEALRLPIGWSQGWGAPIPGQGSATDVWNFWLGPILGLLLTAFAATLGAPFWFDVLNKFMVIRSTVKPHEKSPEEGSEDRQAKSDRTSAGRSETGFAGAGAPTPIELRQPLNTPDGADRDTEVDGCEADHPPGSETRDDELPPARGGVA